MELSRPEYPALLATLQPGQAIGTVNERLKGITKLNNDIADWFAERRRVEEVYAEGLRKLARKQPPDDSSELGVFTTSWQMIVGATTTLGESHGVFAQKIETDLEQPLRSFFNAGKEVQAIKGMVGNLVGISDDIEGSQKKSDKLKDKGGKASTSKVAQAASELDEARSQWESQAPFVFEKLQEVDESRVNLLRDVLTQFQTHETDQAERIRASTEGCLNTLLNVDTTDEVRTFSLRAADGKLASVPEPPRLRGHRQSTANTLSASIPTINTDDGASQISGTTTEQKQGRLGGLKRLGTVIGRRRQSFHPYGRASSPEKTERKSQSNLGILGSFGRRSRSKEPRPTADQNESASASQQISELPSNDQSGDLNPNSSSLEQSRQLPGRPNGTEPESSFRAADSLTSSSGFQAPGLSTLGDSAQFGSSSIEEQRPEPPAKDSEGYTMPPTRNDAISQAEQEAAGESNAPQFKVDIRNAPIQEEDGDAETAMANVANALRAQAGPPKKSGTIRGRRDVRNTVFVPNPEPILSTSQSSADKTPSTTTAPSSSLNMSAFPIAAAAAAVPVAPQTPPTAMSTLASHSPHRPGRHLSLDDKYAGSDTQSVRSGRSLASTASATVKHPEMTNTGLNASIVETVSATFEHGAVTKAFVIGELAMMFKAGESSETSSRIKSIRLENFPVLEKVAPNPTFIDQVPNNAGSYSVNTSLIPKTQVAFKYQVHLDEANTSTHVPIVVSPAWKIEPLQTSVLLTYSLNPSFALHGAKSLTMRNVVLLVNLDGKANSCQSKPVGTFSREKSALYWRLGDITLEPGSPAQQLRARFFTEGEAKSGSNVEARWEITGSEAADLGSGLAVTQLQPEVASTSAAADPFADHDAPPKPEKDSGTWEKIVTEKRIVSGTYTGT